METTGNVCIDAVKISEIVEARENFARRWNVDFSDNNFTTLRSRVLTLLSDVLTNGSKCKSLQREVFFIVGLPCILETNALDLLELSFCFSSTNLYEQLTNIDLSTQKGQLLFLWILENILNTNTGVIPNKADFAKGVAEAISLSQIDACLYKEGATYAFYPVGAELLDKKVVNDTLNWLEKYPASREKFRDALRMFQAKQEPRLIIDNLRLSLELFLKQFNNNPASLEKQNERTGGYLKNADVPKDIRELYSTLIRHYALYNNENVKHNDKCSDNEVEFLIYLTGTFLRFLIQTKSKQENQSELQGEE